MCFVATTVAVLSKSSKQTTKASLAASSDGTTRVHDGEPIVSEQLRRTKRCVCYYVVPSICVLCTITYEAFRLFVLSF